MTTGISRLRTKHALAMAWLALTIPPVPLLWASTKAMETGVDVSILPGISAVLQNMGAQRIPQDTAAFFCIFAVATWMLVQLQALLADVRQRQPTGFRKEPARPLCLYPALGLAGIHDSQPPSGTARTGRRGRSVDIRSPDGHSLAVERLPNPARRSHVVAVRPAEAGTPGHPERPRDQKISLGKTPPPAPDGRDADQ